MTATDEPQPARGAADTPSEAQWLRLSPRMLLIHPLRAIRDLFPALVVLVLGGSRGHGIGGETGNLVAAGVVVLASLVRWFTTRYRITPDQVQLRVGMLRRQTLTVPLDRVRTVDLESSPLHRVLGLTKAVIGTGASSLKPLALDGLGAAQAEDLRVGLLHRARQVQAQERADGVLPAGTSHPEQAPEPPPEPPPEAAVTETTLVRFDPAWVAYAPLSTTGLVTALVASGVVLQALSALGLTESVTASVGHFFEAMGVVAIVAVVALVLVCSSVLGALLSYVLGYWGHTVLRHGAGTLRIARGLLTTRSTTIDERRIRGVRLREPLLMRAAHAASLDAIVTGGRAQAARGTSTALLPATPLAVDRSLAREVLGTDDLVAPLHPHGVRATRRRWSRAFQAAALVAVPDLAAWWHWGWPDWSLLPAAVALVTVPLLATDRARALGHAVTPTSVVARAGSLERRTEVVELDGVIGWDVRQTIFQRRAGLATLTALTAAGHGGYEILDVPLGRAYEIVRTTQDRVLV